ncbi:MAG: sulfatase [Planctomycetes bacterium]|nr:sulfatase [Planctomycetota bacterium]MBI3845231.1 sulfatase [Planctomycetota bacterium]
MSSAAVLVALALAAMASEPDPPPRQNVVVFLVDTLRADAVGCLAPDKGKSATPTIDRLSADGALFTRCSSQAPWTKVSVPSILTSLYPTTNGVVSVLAKLPDSATTIAEAFRSAGYRTAAFFTNPFLGNATNLRQGFDTVYEAKDLLGDRKGPRSNSGTSALVNQKALPWIDVVAHGTDRRPFFLLLHSMDPHEEYCPAPPWDALFADPARASAWHGQWARLKSLDEHPAINRRSRADFARLGIDADAFAATGRGLYQGCVAFDDHEIGRVMDRLKDSGLLDNTIVVVTSDHGEEFLEHGYTSHGHSLYDEMIHVPLVIRAPGAASRRIDLRVASLDIMPTLLDLTNVPYPTGLQGTSLAPLVLGTANSGFVERPVWSEMYTEDPVGGIAFARIDATWKAIFQVKPWRELPRPEFELFATATDPNDRDDVSTKNPDVMKAAKKEILQRYAFLPRLPGVDTSLTLDADTLDRLKALGYLK